MSSGPTYIGMFGKEWRKSDGKKHRRDGPAVEWNFGTNEWFIEGNRHRLDGPAVEHANGTKEWWLNGERHRIDGPAIERIDGSQEYWICGTQYSKNDFYQKYMNEIFIPMLQAESLNSERMKHIEEAKKVIIQYIEQQLLITSADEYGFYDFDHNVLGKNLSLNAGTELSILLAQALSDAGWKGKVGAIVLPDIYNPYIPRTIYFRCYISPGESTYRSRQHVLSIDDGMWILNSHKDRYKQILFKKAREDFKLIPRISFLYNLISWHSLGLFLTAIVVTSAILIKALFVAKCIALLATYFPIALIFLYTKIEFKYKQTKNLLLSKDVKKNETF